METISKDVLLERFADTRLQCKRITKDLLDDEQKDYVKLKVSYT